MATPTPPPLMTIGAAARLLDVSPRTIQRWIDNGRLRATRLPSGRRRLYAADIHTIIGESKP